VGSRRAFRLFFAVSLLFLLLLFLFRDAWLTALGWALVYDQGPAKADAAVVLAGGYWGKRILFAADLVKQGYVPRVLVSGPPGFYGVNESEAAIAWAVKQGDPAVWFVAVPHEATSTRTEAQALLGYVRQHDIHSILLVTSNYHTARAGRIFRKTEREMGGGPDLRVVAAPDKYFAPASWWQSREGRKTAFLEWTKTVSSAFGI
jgi:uncharacterized SAM-binding protein YcdF (DUF218 family)